MKSTQTIRGTIDILLHPISTDKWGRIEFDDRRRIKFGEMFIEQLRSLFGKRVECVISRKDRELISVKEIKKGKK